MKKARANKNVRAGARPRARSTTIDDGTTTASPSITHGASTTNQFIDDIDHHHRRIFNPQINHKLTIVSKPASCPDRRRSIQSQPKTIDIDCCTIHHPSPSPSSQWSPTTIHCSNISNIATSSSNHPPSQHYRHYQQQCPLLMPLPTPLKLTSNNSNMPPVIPQR